MQSFGHFPDSFPNERERAFLSVLYADDATFGERFDRWARETVFEDLDYAIARLLPLLDLRLRKHGIDSVLNGRIRGLYKRTWVMNHRLFAATRDIARQFADRNIPVLLVKGIPLLFEAYKDMGARSMGDVDLLIPPRCARAAFEVLSETGWRLSSPYVPSRAHVTDESFVRLVKEASFVNAQGIELDVHWRLFEYGHPGAEALSFDALRSRSSPAEHDGFAYNAIAPGDMLLHIIVHGAEGNPHRTLRWVTDALAVLSSFKIDWTRFAATAQEGGWNADIVAAFSFLEQEGLYTLPGHAAHLTALPLSRAELRRYYRKANTMYSALGRLPNVWHLYWRYDAHGSLVGKVARLPRYLAYAWGFERVRDLVPFVFQKYATRLAARRLR